MTALEPGLASQPWSVRPQSLHPLSHLSYQLSWHPVVASYLLSLGQSSSDPSLGQLQLHSVPFEPDQRLATVTSFSRPSPLKCASFLLPDPALSGHSSRALPCLLATGDFQGRLEVLDMNSADFRPVYSAAAHSSLVNAVSSAPLSHRPEVATAGRDGITAVWDLRRPIHPVRKLRCAMGQTSRECWTVHFSSFDENVLAVGYEDGTFAEYELRTNRVISQEKLPGGVCSIAQLQLDEGLQSYAWSTSSSHVGLLHPASPASPASQSSRQLQQVAVKASHDKPSTIWSVKQLPGVSRAFACCSGAGDVSFFSARPEEAAPTFGLVPMGSSKVCAQPILHLDFHPTMQIPVCALSSLDRTIRIVTVNRHPLL